MRAADSEAEAEEEEEEEEGLVGELEEEEEEEEDDDELNGLGKEGNDILGDGLIEWMGDFGEDWKVVNGREWCFFRSVSRECRPWDL